MKKIVALVLSLVMVLGLATTAMAAVADNGNDAAAAVANTNVNLWSAKLNPEEAENAKDSEFATYTVEMTALSNSAIMFWDANQAAEKGDVEDFEVNGVDEFVIVATADMADAVVVDGNKIVYLAVASDFEDGWDEKATKVTLPFVVDAKKVCDTDYAMSLAATTFYKFDGDLYVASTAGILFNVDGVAVYGVAATIGTEYVNLGHDYVCDWDDNDYRETVLTKVYCDDCGKEFKFVNAPEADAILTFGVDKYVDTELTFGGQPIFVGLGAVADAPAADAEGDKVESAETFDAGIAMNVGMSVMAAAGSAVVLKKKD